jgi:hypothetical protein
MASSCRFKDCRVRPGSDIRRQIDAEPADYFSFFCSGRFEKLLSSEPEVCASECVARLHLHREMAATALLH